MPLATWAATFCTSFAAYEKDADAAQQQTQVALAGVQDATEGATATAALGDAFAATQRRRPQAAATAATANGVPDVTNGTALAREIEETLADTSTAYAKAAKRSTSLPTAPKEAERRGARRSPSSSPPRSTRRARTPSG